MFARNGLTEQIVSDNGLTSDEFKMFMKKNDITHQQLAWLTDMSRHSKNLSKLWKKCHLCLAQGGQFLLCLQNFSQSTTNQTSALLMLNRYLRSRIDLLKPNLQRDVHVKQFSQVPNKDP